MTATTPNPQSAWSPRHARRSMRVSAMTMAFGAALAATFMTGQPFAIAGGSNYGIAPGAHPNLAGTVREWPVPTPRFARDPAPAPDGSIYIAVMSGNKVARFDPKAQQFKEWDLPPGHRPHGVLVDKQGIVWTTGNGNSTIGRLDPASNKITEYKTPSGGGGPHTLIITDDGSTIWFTMQSGNKIASLDTKSGAIKEYPTSGGPYGLALDKAGNVWFCRMGDNKLGKLEPKTGRMSELDTGSRSRPTTWSSVPARSRSSPTRSRR